MEGVLYLRNHAAAAKTQHRRGRCHDSRSINRLVGVVGLIIGCIRCGRGRAAVKKFVSRAGNRSVAVQRASYRAVYVFALIPQCSCNLAAAYGCNFDLSVVATDAVGMAPMQWDAMEPSSVGCI